MNKEVVEKLTSRLYCDKLLTDMSSRLERNKKLLQRIDPIIKNQQRTSAKNPLSQVIAPASPTIYGKK